MERSLEEIKISKLKSQIENTINDIIECVHNNLAIIIKDSEKELVSYNIKNDDDVKDYAE